MVCRGKTWCACRACRTAGPVSRDLKRTKVLQDMRSVMRDPRTRYQRIKYLKSQNRRLTRWPVPGILDVENGKGGRVGDPVHSYDRTQTLIRMMETVRKTYPSRTLGCACESPSFPHRTCDAAGAQPKGKNDSCGPGSGGTAPPVVTGAEGSTEPDTLSGNHQLVEGTLDDG